MLELDTDALKEVLPSLGRGTPATVLSNVTFDDGNLQQTFVVNELVRRARSGIIGTGGLASIRIANAHAGATTETTDVDVYNLSVAAGTAQAPWPDDMSQFDVWLFSANAFAPGGVGLLTAAAILIIDYPAPFPVGGAGTPDVLYAVYDGDTDLGDVGKFLTIVGSGEMTIFKAVRVPRGGQLRFRSVSTAAAAYTADLFIGVFPRGLGQDAIGAC